MATNKKTRPAPAANGETAVAPAAKEPRPARMTTAQLERRVAALEAEITRLKAALEKNPGTDQLGWRRIIGSFANDPAFDEAMRLGREWRESFRPKTRSRKVKLSDDRS
jgi:peptidoglycan/xylan/chitin deacetylase (PgdA/CDA1 family)